MLVYQIAAGHVGAVMCQKNMEAHWYLVPALVSVATGEPNEGPCIVQERWDVVQQRYLTGNGPARCPSALLRSHETCRRYGTKQEALAEAARRGYHLA